MSKKNKDTEHEDEEEIPEEGQQEPPPKKKSKKIAVIFTLSCLLIGCVIFFWWLIWGRFVDSTDDAYVHGNMVRLTPQVPGIVTEVNVNETDHVDQGQILVRLDETDYRIRLEESKANLAQTVRTVTQKFEQVYALAAQYEMYQAKMMNAEVDYLDRKEIVSTGAVSEEDYIRSETEYFSSKAALQMVRYELMQAISEVQNTRVSTHPLVESAKEQVKQAWVNLQRCTLRAPSHGIIAQRSVQVGESVSAKSNLLAIVPFDQMWVNANFKEVQLSKIRVGQSVSMTADTYGSDIVYTGQVIGIAGGSGAVFSALPPQNATGNWIKIVQRFPVRVALNPEQLRKYPLRLGLSMSVHVDIRDLEGSRVPPVKRLKPLYTTDVFENQEKGATEVIKQILKENMTFDMTISQEISQLLSR